MEKLIIENRTNLSMLEVIDYVRTFRGSITRQ